MRYAVSQLGRYWRSLTAALGRTHPTAADLWAASPRQSSGITAGAFPYHADPRPTTAPRAHTASESAASEVGVNLDHDFPQGDPGAVTCRLCGNGKRRHKGALICGPCDLMEPVGAR